MLLADCVFRARAAPPPGVASAQLVVDASSSVPSSGIDVVNLESKDANDRSVPASDPNKEVLPDFTLLALLVLKDSYMKTVT